MNELHKFVFTLSRRLDLRRFSKHVALQNLLIYYAWETSEKYKNNKLIVTLPTLNDELELPDGIYSMSDIQSFFKYIQYIIRKHETLSSNFLFMFTAIRSVID